jgi:hypothetical protein
MPKRLERTNQIAIETVLPYMLEPPEEIRPETFSRLRHQEIVIILTAAFRVRHTHRDVRYAVADVRKRERIPVALGKHTSRLKKFRKSDWREHKRPLASRPINPSKNKKGGMPSSVVPAGTIKPDQVPLRVERTIQKLPWFAILEILGPFDIPTSFHQLNTFLKPLIQLLDFRKSCIHLNEILMDREFSKKTGSAQHLESAS